MVYWLYAGNTTLINPNYTHSNFGIAGVSTSEVNAFVATNFSSDAATLDIVDVTGTPTHASASSPTGQVFVPVYNSNNWADSYMSYTTLDGAVTGVVMTAVIGVAVTVRDPDGNILGTFPAGTAAGQTHGPGMFLVQMSNGDVFFVPGTGGTPNIAATLQSYGEIGSITVTSGNNFAVDGNVHTGPRFDSDFITPCFVAGTKIKTVRGEIVVEDLQVGDEVITLDDGYREVLWIGSSKLSKLAISVSPHLRPIRIKAGSIGEGRPESDLLVSPQHRVFIRSAIAERMFGESEILVTAKCLVGLDGIEVANDIKEVTYWHFLCDRHVLVYSNGAISESLFTGPEALKSVGSEARKEIIEIFPELASGEMPDLQSARLIVPARRARSLVSRVAANRKALVVG